MADPVAPADRPLPSELPVVALRNSVIFPMSVAPLVVSHPVAVASVNRALAANRMVVLTLQDDDNDAPNPERMKRVGTVGMIRQMARTQNGIQVLVEGLSRVRLTDIRQDEDVIIAALTPLPEPAPVERSVEVDAHVRRLRELIERAFTLATGLSPELRAIVASIDEPLRLVYLVASLIDMKIEDKQLLLEQDSLTIKLSAVATALAREIELKPPRRRRCRTRSASTSCASR
jgi:ATP-dependent Lon protease